MPETVHTTISEQAAGHQEAQAARVQPVLSRAALEGVGVAAQHYYGADDHSIGRDQDGWHNLVIARQNEQSSISRETVGTGANVELALEDSLKQMRTLETVRTKSLAHIEMTETASVDFTSFAHYSPKVAPSRSAYPVPKHLEAMLADDKIGIDTYANTTAKEGWQREVRGLIDDYAVHDPAGQKLVKGLKIRSLDHLTPEQAVKLSAAFVQNISKYTYDAAGNPDGSRADTLTAVDLLREGMSRRSDPAWEGSGVCRNIASTVKAVFESLKQTQGELSMLHNTYAVYGSGLNGAGYDNKRDDGFSLNARRGGHAWNTFVTVDSHGSAAATIIDATWALGRDADTAIEHLDRTDVRAAAQISALFAKSDRKTEAFAGVADYFASLAHPALLGRNVPHQAKDRMAQYAATEYLKAAAQLTEIPEGTRIPDVIWRGAARIGRNIGKLEIETLYKLDTADGGFERERLKSIIKRAHEDNRSPLSLSDKADQLVFGDEQLQELIYEAVGTDKVDKMADVSGKFRMRLRQQHPDQLPAFDPHARQADARELIHIASSAGIHSKDPETIIRNMKQTIKLLAGDDAIAEAIAAGRSEYDLAVNYKSIADALRKRRSPALAG